MDTMAGRVRELEVYRDCKVYRAIGFIGFIGLIGFIGFIGFRAYRVYRV